MEEFFSPGWAAGAVLALVALGFSALQVMRSPDEIKFARGCFLLAAIIAGAQMFVWGIITSRGLGFRLAICVIGFGALGWIAVEAFRYLDRKGNPETTTTQATPEAKTPQPTQPSFTPSPIDLSLPLVVEIEVDQKKQLRINNIGKIPIKDIELSDTAYLFNRQAWEEKRLKIGQVQKPSAPFLKIPEIKAESSSDTFALTKNGFFDFESWDVVVARQPENTNSLDDAFLKYYCLRMTFRDTRSGMKYVIYRVTGSIIDAPSAFENLDRNAIGGPARHIFLQDIPQVLINHQRELYKNDSAKELS